ncbi:MAG TPA: hypothetical protein ENK28_00745 [Aliiroseovarius sp.]|nr:hypothetical protein [Aliiroseovarius sp.]
MADVGSWDVKTSTSALDDSQTVILRQVADRKVTDKFGNGDYPVMIIRCLENTTSIYIVAGGHFLSDHQGYGLVEYRLDQGAKRQIEMKASTDNTALGLWRGRSAIPFLKSLFDKEIIVMRITPLSKAPAEFSFDIGGLSEAIVPLRNSCNW